MIPPEHQLTLPAGIDDARSRTILGLLEARFGALPVENLLVYLVENAPVSALPALGWQFDVPSSSWASATPEQRRQLISEAIALQRKRGTIGATVTALLMAGSPPVHIERHTVLVADGSLYADGTFAAGAANHEGIYWIVLASHQLLTEPQKTRYAAIAKDWMPGTRHFGGFYYVDDESKFGQIEEYEGEETVPLVVSTWVLMGPTTTVVFTASRTLVSGSNEDWSALFAEDWSLGDPTVSVTSMAIEGRTITITLSGVPDLVAYDLVFSYTGTDARSRLTGNPLQATGVLPDWL